MKKKSYNMLFYKDSYDLISDGMFSGITLILLIIKLSYLININESLMLVHIISSCLLAILFITNLYCFLIKLKSIWLTIKTLRIENENLKMKIEKIK